MNRKMGRVGGQRRAKTNMKRDSKDDHLESYSSLMFPLFLSSHVFSAANHLYHVKKIESDTQHVFYSKCL